MMGWPRVSRQVSPEVLQQECPLRERRRHPAGSVQLRAEEHGEAPSSRNADSCWFLTSLLVLKVFSRTSLGGLETLLTEQERLASAAPPEPEEHPEHAEVLDVRLREKHIQEHGRSGIIPKSFYEFLL